MAIEYENDVARFSGTVSVEEAETLLQWMQQHPKSVADFSACTHIHAAALQVLMAAQISVTAWPNDEHFKNWLTAALGNQEEE